MLSPGDVLEARYRIVRPLKRGGMGAVYEAIDTRLGSRVALKETLYQDEHLRRQFEREAQLLAALRHPALTKVIDHVGREGRQPAASKPLRMRADLTIPRSLAVPGTPTAATPADAAAA